MVRSPTKGGTKKRSIEKRSPQTRGYVARNVAIHSTTPIARGPKIGGTEKGSKKTNN